MKTLGMIGGTGWPSTIGYYRIINQTINKKLGKLHSARLLIHSIDFQNMMDISNYGEDMEPVVDYYIDAAKKLEYSGAEALMLCSNTTHNMVDNIQPNINIPILHIADAVGKEINKSGMAKVALLGTKLTMELDFYKDKLSKYNVETIVPDSDSREFINTTIFEELELNILKPETKAKYLQIIQKLQDEGAEGIILGCTEIPLLISQDDCDIKLFDTIEIHSEAAVEFILG